MTYRDLIPGEIYYCTYELGLSYLNKIKDKDCNIIAYIDTKSNIYTKGGSCNSLDCRLATIEEKQWLEVCIKANKFIPKNEIIFDLKKESQYIKLSDVKANEYYYAEYGGSIKGNAIVKAKENGSFNNSCGIIKDSAIYISSNNWSCNQNIRTATREEIIHLSCCISHSTFMKKERALELAGLTTDNRLSMDSILEDCVKQYPVGTKYICAGDGISEFTVTAQNFKIYNNDTVYGQPNKGCLYRYHKYAKIIEEPVKESIEESIPKYVECIEVWNGIGASIKGKIYNTSEKQDFSSFKWKRILEGTNLGIYFKPATKKAFDAQNKPDNRVIKCDSQKEWDVLCDSKYNVNNTIKKAWFGGTSHYMYIDEGMHGSYVPDSNYIVYSFKEFCNECGLDYKTSSYVDDFHSAGTIKTSKAIYSDIIEVKKLKTFSK